MTDDASRKRHHVDLDAVLELAMQAARRAGDEIRRAHHATTTTRVATAKSGATDLVTATDEHCEALVTACIRQRFPQHAIIGEEASGADCQYTLTDAPTWTIDPIDGTANFVHHLPLTCVLIAFLLDQQPVVGVTYDPSRDELFWAVQGRGAYVDTGRPPDPPPDTVAGTIETGGANNSDSTRRRLAVSSTTDIPHAVVSLDAGFGRTVAAVDRYLRVQRALLLQQIRSIRVVGSCGLTMAYVAAGRLDACLEQGSWTDQTGPKIWDLAAGKLLVQEAGGVTRDVTSAATAHQPLHLLERSVFCAATPQLADALLTTVFETEGSV